VFADIPVQIDQLLVDGGHGPSAGRVIRRSTSSKSAGALKAVVRDGTFLDLATPQLLAVCS
jgi:hypothetical protein